MTSEPGVGKRRLRGACCAGVSVGSTFAAGDLLQSTGQAGQTCIGLALHARGGFSLVE